MVRMLMDALKLFVKGQLFREPLVVMRLWAIGTALTLAVMIALFKLGVPLWLAVGVSALGGGALQPWLFRDLKYH